MVTGPGMADNLGSLSEPQGFLCGARLASPKPLFCRVKGIEGLRVIDASVMPTLTSGNTHAPTVMIGEKGADLVKGKTLPPMPDH